MQSNAETSIPHHLESLSLTELQDTNEWNNNKYLHRHVKITPELHVERTKRKALNVSLQFRLDVDHRIRPHISTVKLIFPMFLISP
jgi:hypothetical protein